MLVFTSSVPYVINLKLNLAVVAVFMFLTHVPLTMSLLWLPLALLEIYIFGLGLSLLLAAAYVKYRDLSFIWEVVMQAGFYLTPIIYPLSIITNITIQKILLLNPVAQAIQDSRT